MGSTPPQFYPRMTPWMTGLGRRLEAEWDRVMADPVCSAWYGRLGELLAERMGQRLPEESEGRLSVGACLLRGVVNDPAVALDRLVAAIRERHARLARVHGPSLGWWVLVQGFHFALRDDFSLPEEWRRLLKLEHLSPESRIGIGEDGQARVPIGEPKAHVDEWYHYTDSLLPPARRGRPPGAKSFHLTKSRVKAAYARLKRQMPQGQRPSMIDLALEVTERDARGKERTPSPDTLAKFIKDNRLKLD